MFYNERCSKYLKNQFFSNICTFLSVIRQNFEYNFRIFANFHIKTQKSMDFTRRFPKTNFFFLGGGDFLIKIILFTLKIYFLTTKDAQSFVIISFLTTCLHF